MGRVLVELHSDFCKSQLFGLVRRQSVLLVTERAAVDMKLMAGGSPPPVREVLSEGSETLY